MEEGILRLLAPTSASVTVSFYADDPQKLAASEEVIKALLSVVGKARRGLYTVPLAALCNLLDWPPHRVVKALQVEGQISPGFLSPFKPQLDTYSIFCCSTRSLRL